VYVGETGRSIKKRIKEHIWDIRAFGDKPASNHLIHHVHVKRKTNKTRTVSKGHVCPH
jgi:hypothetical protein